MVLCLICASYPKNPNKREMGREKTFLRGTLANNLFLKKLHFRYQMNEGISAEQHVKHMKDMCLCLKKCAGSLSRSFATLFSATKLGRTPLVFMMLRKHSYTRK